MDNKEKIVFIRHGYGEPPETHVAKASNVDDALFNFVCGALGYSVVKVSVDKKEDLKVGLI